MSKLDDMAAEVYRTTRLVQSLSDHLREERDSVRAREANLKSAKLALGHQLDALAMVSSAPSPAKCEALKLGRLDQAADYQKLHGVFVLDALTQDTSLDLDQAALALYGIVRHNGDDDVSLRLRGREAAKLSPDVALIRLAAILDEQGVG